MFAHEAEAQGAPNAALAVYRGQKAHADAARVLRSLGRTTEALAELAQDSAYGRADRAGRPAPGGAQLRGRGRRLPEGARSHPVGRAGRVRAGVGAAGAGQSRGGAGYGEEARAQDRPRVVPRRADVLLRGRVRFRFRLRGRTRAAVSAEPAGQRCTGVVGADRVGREGGRTGPGDVRLRDARRRDRYGHAHWRRGTMSRPSTRRSCFRRFLRRDGKPKDALAALDDYLQRFPSGSLRGKARLEQAYVFRDDIRDEGLYRATLERLVVEEPGSAWAPLRRNLLAESKKQAALSRCTDAAHSSCTRQGKPLQYVELRRARRRETLDIDPVWIRMSYRQLNR